MPIQHVDGPALDGWRSSCNACGWMGHRVSTGPGKKLRRHDRECLMVVRIAAARMIAQWARSPSSSRLRRAAVRLWDLTAQRDRANKSDRAVNAHL
jgi:hypothetical protein